MTIQSKPFVTVPRNELREALKRAGKIAEDISKGRYYSYNDKPGLTHRVYLRTVVGYGETNKRILQITSTNRHQVATSIVLTQDAIDLPLIAIDQRRIAGVVSWLAGKQTGDCKSKQVDIAIDADGDVWMAPEGRGHAICTANGNDNDGSIVSAVCMTNLAKDESELGMENIEKMFNLADYPANGCAELDKVAIKQLKDLVRPSKGNYDNRTAIRFETDGVLGVFADKSGAGEIVAGSCSRIDELRVTMVKSGELWRLLQCVDKAGVRLGWHRSVCGKNGMTGADRYMDALTAVDSMTRVLCVADDRTHEVTGEDAMPKAA